MKLATGFKKTSLIVVKIFNDEFESDELIVESVFSSLHEEITSESEEETQVVEDKSLNRSSVTNSEAFDCFTRVLEWLEEHST